jgi:hypothetical protein
MPCSFLKFGSLCGFKGGGLAFNACITQTGDEGTWYGYSQDIPGTTVDPTHVKDGTLWYAYKWKADGVFVMQFGDAGDEKLTGVDIVLITGPDNVKKSASWDDVNKYYTFTDAKMANDLITKYNAGELDEGCFKVEIMPDLFIHYDFASILWGTR